MVDIRMYEAAMYSLWTQCTRGGGVTCHVLQCYTQVWQQHPHVTIARVTLQLELRCNIQQPGSNQFNLCFYPLVEAELITFFNGTDKARSVLLHLSQPHSPFSSVAYYVPSVSQLVFTITEKAPGWKLVGSALTFKTPLRHYAKRALTPR